jgi:hypothetical protein
VATPDDLQALQNYGNARISGTYQYDTTMIDGVKIDEIRGAIDPKISSMSSQTRTLAHDLLDVLI